MHKTICFKKDKIVNKTIVRSKWHRWKAADLKGKVVWLQMLGKITKSINQFLHINLMTEVIESQITFPHMQERIVVIVVNKAVVV